MTSEQRRVLELVRRHGWNATAFQTLESGYSYFFNGDDACVAYVETPGAWVAAGAPLAAPAALGSVATAFVDTARLAGKRACFFGTEARFRDAAGAALRSVPIGEQPEWNPGAWDEVLAQHKSLREQLRRARAKGVRVRRVSAAELEAGAARDSMRRVADRWLATRRMPPMDFLVRLEPFTFPEQRACFVAEQAGRMIGFAAAIPVPARDGWFLEDLVRDPSAPNGTSELLVDAVMRWAAAERSPWLTLGLAPLAGELGSLLRLARSSARCFYDFDGLRAYKAKLRPSAWSQIFLSYPAGPAGQTEWLSIFDALTAFAHGDALRFALRSFARQTRTVSPLSSRRLAQRLSPSAPPEPC